MCIYTVWVVDDDEDDQHFIRSAFASGEIPIEVFVLNDGSEVLPKLNESAALPKLILLDINMPRQNGFDTLAELRAIPAYTTIPVIMLSTSCAEGDRNRSLALGANQFITKPISYDQLKSLIKEMSDEWNLA